SPRRRRRESRVRSAVALAVAAVAAMLMQTTIFPSLPGLPVVPDLILVLAVYLGVAHQTIGGAAGAFLLGYFLDTFSGTLLGQNSFALSAVYLSVRFVARHLWFERGLPVMALAFFGGLVRGVAVVGIRLWYLQIEGGAQMRYYSEKNRIRLVRVPAPRGVVYDRNGEILVDNRPSFDVVFVPEDAGERRRQVLKTLAGYLGEEE